MRFPTRFLRGVLAALVVSTLSTTSFALDLDSVRTGRASFYRAPKGRGACTLPPTAPWDSFYVALNTRDWSRSAACGACLRVVGERDSVLVRVNDRCPGCKPGGIDLSPAAFRALAPLGRGRTDVRWRFEACPESSLVIARTRGSSRYWSSLQVWGLPWPVDSLAVARDSGWIPFTRMRHNHFTARNLPDLPWTIRTVDRRGRERIDSLLPLEPGATLRPDLPPVDSAADSTNSTSPTDSVTDR